MLLTSSPPIVITGYCWERKGDRPLGVESEWGCEHGQRGCAPNSSNHPELILHGEGKDDCSALSSGEENRFGYMLCTSRYSPRPCCCIAVWAQCSSQSPSAHMSGSHAGKHWNLKPPPQESDAGTLEHLMLAAKKKIEQEVEHGDFRVGAVDCLP